MKDIHSPDANVRDLQIKALLGYANPWCPDQLDATFDRLTRCYRQNWTSFEEGYGEGSYGRLRLAFAWAAYRLRTEGVIHPDDLEIVEAYYSVPRYTASKWDDGVDFATPKERLRQALLKPLCQELNSTE